MPNIKTEWTATDSARARLEDAALKLHYLTTCGDEFDWDIPGAIEEIVKARVEAARPAGCDVPVEDLLTGDDLRLARKCDFLHDLMRECAEGIAQLLGTDLRKEFGESPALSAGPLLPGHNLSLSERS